MKLAGWLFFSLLLAASVNAKFDRPSEFERMRALGNRFEEPAPLPALLTPDDDFPPIKQPRANDWLARHVEKGETFQDYCTGSANKPDATRRIIYLLPIGDFADESAPAMEDVRAYAAAFFQMEVQLLPAYQPHDLEFEPRKNRHDGQRQLLTGSIRTFLKQKLPTDAYCLLGITMTDLYPDPTWNFVFGEASLAERVGVYSFARYDPAFWDEARDQDYRSLILQRSCKVLAHETAHLFGLSHCIYFDCVVNGSNGMDETDAQPQHLCPICLRKLHHSIGFNPLKRYEELARFYRRQKWFEDYDWIQRQLARIPREK